VHQHTVLALDAMQRAATLWIHVMQWLNDRKRYGALSIIMHWVMLALMVAVYVCADLREIFPKGSDLREDMKVWHNMLGLLVLALVWLRLALLLPGIHPVDDPRSPQWQKRAAKLMHVALYALMILLPLTGWLALSADGKPVHFFGVDLPPLIGPSKFMAHLLEDIHEFGGQAGYVLIGLHAAAALFHHYVIRDNTLLRMLPGWRSNER
jgi:cytochrome b561